MKKIVVWASFLSELWQKKKTSVPVIKITSLEHPGVEMFRTLIDAQLYNRMNAEKGIFIVESSKVTCVAHRMSVIYGT